MKMKRFELNFYEDKVNDVLRIGGASYDLKECCKLLNKLNDECEFLANQRDYWKQKYEEGTETFTLNPNFLLKMLINDNKQLRKENGDFHKSIKEYEELRKRLNKDKSRLIEEKMSLGAFIIEKGLMEEYEKWENE